MQVVNPDNGIEYNLVRGYTNYNVSRTPDMNNRPGILTDGKYMTAGTKYDKAWMGFKSNRDSKKNHVSLTFDLYAPASISQIILSPNMIWQITRPFLRTSKSILLTTKQTGSC